MAMPDFFKTSQKHVSQKHMHAAEDYCKQRLSITGIPAQAARKRLTALKIHTNQLSWQRDTVDNREYRTLLWIQNSHASVKGEERPRAKRFATAVAENFSYVNNIPKYRNLYNATSHHNCA